MTTAERIAAAIVDTDKAVTLAEGRLNAARGADVTARSFAYAYAAGRADGLRQAQILALGGPNVSPNRWANDPARHTTPATIDRPEA